MGGLRYENISDGGMFRAVMRLRFFPNMIRNRYFPDPIEKPTSWLVTNEMGNAHNRVVRRSAFFFVYPFAQ